MQIFVDLTEKNEVTEVKEDGTVPRPSLLSTRPQMNVPPQEVTTTLDEVFEQEQSAGTCWAAF